MKCFLCVLSLFVALVVVGPPAGAEATYADAYTRALATGKPLVVWQGAAVHLPSIVATKDEWVNFVGNIPDGTPNAITVGVPEGGDIWYVESISDANASGDPRFTPTAEVRRSIRKWQDLRSLVESPAQVMPMIDALKTRKSTGYGGLYPGVGPVYGSKSEQSPTFHRP